MNYLDSSDQHIDVLKEGLREAEKENIFKTNILCVVVGSAGDGTII
jgi:hypothetical protein